MIHEHQAQRDRPEHQAEAAARDLGRVAIPIEGGPKGELEEQEPAIQPHIEGVCAHITVEAVHLLEGGDVVEHPLAVGPPEAPGGVVVVVGLVGKLVVVAVQPHPFDRAALAGQGTHQHQHPLHPAGRHETAVGHQPVQSQGHADHGDPVQQAQGHDRLPAPELGQQGKDCRHMHGQHEAGGAALDFALLAPQGFAGDDQGGPHAGFLGRRQTGGFVVLEAGTRGAARGGGVSGNNQDNLQRGAQAPSSLRTQGIGAAHHWPGMPAVAKASAAKSNRAEIPARQHGCQCPSPL